MRNLRDKTPEHLQATLLVPHTYDFRSKKQTQLPCVNSTRYGLRSIRYEAVGSGTASRMSLDLRNLILSSRGCSRPGTGSTVNVLLVLPDFYFCSVQFSFPVNFLFFSPFSFFVFPYVYFNDFYFQSSVLNLLCYNMLNFLSHSFHCTHNLRPLLWTCQ